MKGLGESIEYVASVGAHLLCLITIDFIISIAADEVREVIVKLLVDDEYHVQLNNGVPARVLTWGALLIGSP